jgi:alpha-1,6-mannosyltransferase
MGALAVAEIAYLLSISQFFITPRFPRRVVIIGLILAAVWHLAFLRVPSGADEDIHRYVWDGRLQRLGYNPYIVVPSDPAVQWLHTPETRNMSSPDLASPYPPGAQLFFRAVTAIHESTFALKLAFVICDFAIALALFDILRYSGQGAHLCLAYAWNPLLAIEAAGAGHIDIVCALLLAISAAALGRRWRATSAIALGLAIAVRLLPIVLIPLYWKRIRIRDGVLAAAVFTLAYFPFLNHGYIPIGSLGSYLQSFRFNDPLFAMLNYLAPVELLAVFAVLAGLVTAIWLRSRSSEWSSDLFAWPMAASLLCAPVVFPWYLLSLLPFLTSASTVLIMVWTVSIIPTYVQWHLRALGLPWSALPRWVMLLEYGSIAFIGMLILLRRYARRRAPSCTTDGAV